MKTLQYSAICGVARIEKIVTKSRSKWFDDDYDCDVNYGWTLKDIHPLRKPVKCKGARQLWNVPPNILRMIKRQLPKLDFSET
jgi:hypothetical protein